MIRAGVIALAWLFCSGSALQAQDVERELQSLPYLPGDELDQEKLNRMSQEFARLLKRTREAGSIHKMAPPMTRNAISVGQKQAGVTSPETGRPRFLQSGGASVCVILTIYAPSKQIAALAHLDTGTAIGPSVRAMAGRMGLARGDRAEARLIGGSENISENIFEEALYHLSLAGIDVVETRIKSGADMKKRYNDGILINSETGEIFELESLPKDQPRPELDGPLNVPVTFADGSL